MYVCLPGVSLCGCMYLTCVYNMREHRIRNGVNVLFWFAIDLVENSAGEPAIVSRGPPPETMVEIVEKLRFVSAHSHCPMRVEHMMDARTHARTHRSEF